MANVQKMSGQRVLFWQYLPKYQKSKKFPVNYKKQGKHTLAKRRAEVKGEISLM